MPTAVEWAQTDMEGRSLFRLLTRRPGSSLVALSPWHILHTPSERGLMGRFPFEIRGGGMGPGGTVQGFGRAMTLFNAKVRAVILAELDAPEVEIAKGRRFTYRLGDLVRHARRAPRGAPRSRLKGRLTLLTAGARCFVHWDGEPDPTEQRLPLLAPALSLAPEPARDPAASTLKDGP